MPFEHGGATIRARELTIADDDRIGDLMARLDEHSGSQVTRYRFAEFMLAADIDGEPPLPLVDEHSTDAAIAGSFTAWGKLPRKFGQRWQQELNTEDADPKP